MQVRDLLRPASAIALISSAAAQTPTILLEEAEILESVAVVTSLQRAELDELGRAFVLAQIRGIRDPNPSLAALIQDRAILHPTGPLGLLASGPFDVGASGDLAVVGSSTLVPTFALLWQGHLIADEGGVASAPGLPAGTTYLGFEEVCSNGERLVLARLRLSTGPAVMRYQFAADGAVLASEVLLQHDVLRIAGNQEGDWLATVQGSPYGSGAILRNGVVLVRAGDPSPFPGVSYGSLTDAHADIDDSGRVAFAAELAGLIGDSVLVRDGAVVARMGDVLPALAPGVLGSGLHETPVALSNSGDLYWFADVGGGDDALMRNRDVIARPGVTLVAGRSVTRVYASFSISPSGRFWCGAVELDGSKDAIIGVDFGLAERFTGCSANRGSLALVAGEVIAGRTIELELAGPSAPMQARLHLSRARIANSHGCGAAFPFGELLIDPARSLGVLQAGTFTGAPLRLPIAIPSDPALVDLELFSQGVFVGPTGGRPRLALTEGLRFEIGGP